MSALSDLRRRMARWISPKPAGIRVAAGSAVGGIFAASSRMYASARNTRLTAGWQQTNSSADAELVSSLITLRSRSRSLIRDSAYAKRARLIVINNVVGAGIGMQAKVYNTRNELNKRVNDDIEQAWERWCKADSCHTGGTLHFSDLERAAMGQVFEAGEVFVRKHYSAFGDSAVPFSLELIEAERLADTLGDSPSNPSSPPMPGNVFRLGVEVDEFHRPVAYWFYRRHPGEIFVGQQNWDRLERVPANQIIHLKLTDRWPQCRGEPWLHAVSRKLNDMDGYSEAEIIAARGAASYMGFIETPEGSNANIGEEQPDGTQQLELTPGIFEKLTPGEKMNFFSPNRPNTALDPFMRYMLREVAAGVGVSYESLSRDYAQSNYSSSRLALLDDRDLWRVLQSWFIRSFREQVHAEWLRQAVFARAIPSLGVEQYAADPVTFGESVAFKPRGWSWIDPTKEVEAYREAVRCGFMTVTGVIARTGDGMDLEDLLDERRQELDDMASKKLLFDTDPSLAVARPNATQDPAAVPAQAAPSAQPPAAGSKAAAVVNLGRRDA